MPGQPHHDTKGIPLPRPYYVLWDGNEELIADESKTLLCPLCKDPYVNKHIFQCPDGHIFCSECVKSNPRVCPNKTCTMRISRNKPIRNRQLEHIVEGTNVLEETNSVTVIRSSLPVEGQAGVNDRTVATAGSTYRDAVVTSPPRPTCQNCHFQLQPNAVRFKCLRCPSFLVCDKCADIGHHAQHPLALITNSQTVVSKANSFAAFCSRNTQNQEVTKPRVPPAAPPRMRLVRRHRSIGSYRFRRYVRRRRR